MSDEYPITLAHAAQACQVAEAALAEIGMHCALTGGCLYRGGSCKDIDIVIYPHDPKNAATQDAIFADGAQERPVG